MHSYLPQSGGCDSSIEKEAVHPATLASRRVKMPPKKRIKVEGLVPSITAVIKPAESEVKEKEVVPMEEVKEKAPAPAEEVQEESASDQEREAVSTQTKDESKLTSPSTQAGDDPMRPSQSPSQMEQAADNRKRRFVPYWTVLFPWVEYNKETDSMFCKPCSRAGRDNIYTSTGCRNFRKSSLMDHMITSDHKSAATAMEAAEKAEEEARRNRPVPEASLPSLQRENQGDASMPNQVQGADANHLIHAIEEAAGVNNKERGIVVAMKAVEWLAREGLPLDKLPALLKLLENLGIPHVEMLLKTDGGSQHGEQSCQAEHVGVQHREQSCQVEHVGAQVTLDQMGQARNQNEG